MFLDSKREGAKIVESILGPAHKHIPGVEEVVQRETV